MGTLFRENRAGSSGVSGKPQHDGGSGTNWRRGTVRALSRRKEEEGGRTLFSRSHDLGGGGRGDG